MKKRNVGAELAMHVSAPKGITLIALIITIVVMLILVGVTVNFTIGENGILSQAKQAKKEYEIGQVKEIFSSNYSLEYYQKTGYWPSDEAITKIAEISLKTGINPDKFIVYHDKLAIKENKTNNEVEGYTKQVEEYIFYNWYKVTVDEITYLESEETYTIEEPINGLIHDMSNRALALDLNGDGYVNDKDIEKAEDFVYKNHAGINFLNEPYSSEKNVIYAQIMGIYTEDNWYEDGYNFPLVCITDPESYYDPMDLDFLECISFQVTKFTELFIYGAYYNR